MPATDLRVTFTQVSMLAVAKSQKIIKYPGSTEFKNSQTYIWNTVIQELKINPKQIQNSEIDEPSELMFFMTSNIMNPNNYNGLLLYQLCITIENCTLTLTFLHTVKIDRSKTGANNCHPDTTC